MNGTLIYPHEPGFKTDGASQAAAAAVAPRAESLRERVFKALTERPMTADECAEVVGATPFAIRPRLSELVAQGRIERTNDLRPNTSGHRAHVHRACALL